MKQLPYLLALLLLSAALCSAHPHQGNRLSREQLIQTGDLFSEIAEQVKPAVVYIQVKKEKKKQARKKPSAFAKFFSNEKSGPEVESFFEDETSYGAGSGFIINGRGYILTNSHVIDGATEITVTLADRTSLKAKLIGADKQTDVGVIQITRDQPPLPTVFLGDSDDLKSGQWVLAIGLPYEFIQTVTAGIVSATGRSSIGVSDYESFIQTDAAINQGNSGGPLVNIHGEVIGINTAFLTQTGGYTGIGFAVPVNIARKVSEQLIAKGTVTRGWLGVGLKAVPISQLVRQNIPPSTGAAIVAQVKADSPAEKAGLQKDDIITSINQTTITGPADLRNKIALSAPGSVVSLHYYRDGQKYSTLVELDTLQ